MSCENDSKVRQIVQQEMKDCQKKYVSNIKHSDWFKSKKIQRDLLKYNHKLVAISKIRYHNARQSEYKHDLIPNIKKIVERNRYQFVFLKSIIRKPRY